MQLLEVTPRLEHELPILVKVEGCDLEIEYNLLLSAPAHFDEGAPEVCEYFLDVYLVYTHHE